MLGVDNTSGEFVVVTVRTRNSRVFHSGCGVLAGAKEWQPIQLVDLGRFGRSGWLCRRSDGSPLPRVCVSCRVMNRG